ncbi:MAG TPA: hypothetical protein VG186_13790 [Solirubrobacteraceae bacterium]|nr:hypothetical protein [Solirubrobacteraceae bacterium]
MSAGSIATPRSRLAAFGGLRRPAATGLIVRARVAKVAVAVLVFYALVVAVYLGAGGGVRDFINVSPHFIERGDTSSVISSPSVYDYGAHHLGQKATGYDGQFYYFIALDPTRAAHYIDSPPYRYGRILYPMLARFAALEQPAAVPWAMLIISWLAVGGGVLALAAWLARRGASPWFAALYGLFPGMLVAFQHDLTEPLAYGLVALAVYLFDFGGRRGVLLSAAAFGLAALTRETTVLFAILFGLSIIAGRPNSSRPRALRARARQAFGFFALALVPFLTWLAVDYALLGIANPGTVDPVPFKGIIGPFNPSVELLFVGIPALLFSVALLPGLRAKTGRLERYCVLANTGLAVVFSTGALWNNYEGVGRAAIAVVLAAILCMPYRRERPAGRAALLGRAAAVGVPFTLWMLPVLFGVYVNFAGRLFNA